QHATPGTRRSIGSVVICAPDADRSRSAPRHGAVITSGGSASGGSRSLNGEVVTRVLRDTDLPLVLHADRARALLGATASLPQWPAGDREPAVLHLGRARVGAAPRCLQHGQLRRRPTS